MANRSIDYSFVMNAEIALAKLEAGAMGLDSYINSALVGASYIVQQEMKSRVNEGVGAANGQGIKNNIKIDINPAKMTAEVTPTPPYAAALEYGSKPHMPNVDPDGALAQWCELKGLNLWGVAMSIKKKGTAPHPFVEPTYQAMEGPVIKVFENRMAAYVKGF